MEIKALNTLIGVAAGGKRPEYIDVHSYGAVVITGGVMATRDDLIENIRFRRPVLLRRFKVIDEECLEELESIAKICEGTGQPISDSPIVVQILEGDCDVDDRLKAILDPIINRGRRYMVYLMVTSAIQESGLAGYVTTQNKGCLKIVLGSTEETFRLFYTSARTTSPETEHEYDLAIPYEWTLDEIKEARNEGAPEIEEAVFPCYGVSVTWGKGSGARHVEELYAEGIMVDLIL